MRRILASAASLALPLGLLVGVTPSASASTNLGTVVARIFGAGVWTITPSSLSGSVGDRFVFENRGISGNNDPAIFVSLQSDTGAVSLDGDPCTGPETCKVLDQQGPTPNTATFTIDSGGTIKVMRRNGGITQIGTLTITASSSGGGGLEDLANPTYTATVDANGGSCSGTTSWQRIVNNAAFPGVFTLPSANDCTRPNYTLAGWASTANATTVRFAPLTPYLMGNSNVTLYAVWRPNGVEVVYDANVGLDTECIAGGTNLTTAAERRSKATVVAVGSATATAAPCSPAGQTLSGWSLTGDGASVAAPGAALPASLTSGTSVTLYAKWSVPAPAVEPTPAVERTIIISGERGEVSGTSGIIITGEATGFVAGARVVPYIRFPGQTGYTAGSARPEIGADGSFSWQRKTGKKTYVYFTSEDGNVFSNRVIIPAS